MNTPTHLSLALVLFARRKAPKRTPWIIAGALSPDFIMFILVGYEALLGTPFDVIFNEKYFQPLWQDLIDLFNSIPIYLGLLAIGFWRGKRLGLFFFALAALLHIGLDFPLHHDDAHRHFYPLSDFRFVSPISYWDPAHHGIWVGVVEIAVLAISTYFAQRIFVRKWAKWLFIVIMVLMMIPHIGFTAMYFAGVWI